MNQHKRILGALALILVVCLSSIIIVASDDYSDDTTELTLGSSVSKSSITPTQYSSASISISGATVTIRVASSGYSSTIDDIYKINWGDGTSRAELNSANNASKSHTYSSNGNYTISMTIETWKDGANLLATTSDSVSVTVNSYSTVTNYTVRYNLNGGYIVSGISSTRTVSSGTTITLPGMADVEKDNAYLSGWTLNSTSGTKYPTLGTYRVTSNVTFYAEWTTSTYAVFFYANGGTGDIDSKSAEYGSTITLPTSGFTREGYTLTGWNTKADGSGTNYALGSSFLVSAESKLYAVWVELPLNITSTPTSDPYPAGTQYIYDPTASRTNVTWSLENAPDWLSITGNRIEGTIPYSYLEPATVTFTVKATSGSDVKTQLVTINIVPKEVAPPVIDTSAPSTGKVGELYSFNPTEKVWFDLADDYMGAGSGYSKYIEGADWLSFKGDLGAIDLIISGTPTEAGTYTVTVGFWKTSDHYQKSNIRIQWTIEVSEAPPTYTVSFDPNGGTGEITPQTVEPGVSIKLPQSGFNKSGHILKGWTLGSTSGTFYDIGATYAVNSNAVFYAQWVQEPSGDHGAPTELKVGETYDFSPNMQSSIWPLYLEVNNNRYYSINYTGPDWLEQTGDKRQLRFQGTPTEPGTYHVTVILNGDNSTYVNASKVEWYIIVTEDIPDRFTASFNANGGTGTVPSKDAQPNNAITLPSDGVSKNGYTLIGWSEGSVSGPTYNLGSIYTMTSDVTFYAKWVANSNLVVFDANGGIGNITYIAATNDTVTLPSEGFTKTGHILAGWYLSENPDSIYAPGYTYLISGQTTMYAYWISNNTSYVTVTYNANGGTGNISSQILESGNSVVLPQSGFNKSGNNMTGWNINADGSGIGYDLGAYVVVTSNKTFYAQWSSAEAADVTVTFNLNGGYGSVASQTVKAGSVINQPSTPVRDGHIFKGWRVIGGADWDFTKPVSESMTLMAQWDQHFTITNNYLIVNVTVNAKYAGGIHTVNWGDGTKETKTGSTFSHTYSSASAGRITITTAVDDQIPLSSSLPYNLTSQPVFTVTFINGEQVVKTTVIDGKTVAVPEEILVPPGHKITGWYTDADFNTEYNFDAPITKNITLYAKVVSGDTSQDNNNLIWFIIATLVVLIICALALILFKVKGVPIALVVVIAYLYILYILGMI